jgi:predicted nucleic acid-binding protein
MPVEQIYWDSDAFLGWFQEEPGKVELCEGTIERAQNGETLIITSALTIAEVLWLRGGPPIPQEKDKLVRKFYRRSYIRVRDVTRAVSESAQDLVGKYGIRPKDAIHVATAKVIALETFDEWLLKKSGVVGNPNLIIRKPIPPAQPKLFT